MHTGRSGPGRAATRTRVLAGGGALILALVLASCASLVGSSSGAKPQPPTPDASPAPSAEEDDHPLATGALVPMSTNDGVARWGEVEIVDGPGGAVTVRVRLDTGLPAGAKLALTAASARDTGCLDDRTLELELELEPDAGADDAADPDANAGTDPQPGTGAPAESGAGASDDRAADAVRTGEIELPLPLLWPLDDPTVWTHLVATTGAPSSPDCRGILASAPLEWRIPPLREFLYDMQDAGPQPGAMGGVSSAGGRLYAYKVVQDDVLHAVVRRFGITMDDVRALNPFRDTPDFGMLYVDEVLNLSLDTR